MFRKKITRTQDKISISLKNWDPEPSWYTPFFLYTVIGISKFIMKVLNKIEIVNQDTLINLQARNNRGLLTFSNHNSLFDDPFLISCSAPINIVRQRYIATDAQNFFSKKVTGFIFSQGQCVPIVRGAGINQPGFEYLKKILQEGSWVHIFPEGTRNRKPELGIQNNFTQGIAHLLLAAYPIILPFYHSGMEKILPVGAILPRVGKKVKIVFGEPILFDEELYKNILKENSIDTSNTRESVQVITDWTFQLLKNLEQGNTKR